MKDEARKNKDRNRLQASQRGSLRLWISLAVVFLILFVAALGQWDLALAGMIGLIVGNGASALFSGR